ncbi:MAG: hypothetical protein MAG581_00827 [Deltaproteobacteria bacterium]|nr:hypothetical protein [Deltaproteobacteria bacterium]
MHRLTEFRGIRNLVLGCKQRLENLNLGGSMRANKIPDGYHTVTPYLLVHEVSAFLEYLEKVFSTKELRRTTLAEGVVHHARIRIGDSVLMIGEAGDHQPAVPTVLYMYVDDVDETYQLALKHGAKSLREPAEQYYGERNAGVEVPFGNQWWFAVHLQNVSLEEMEKRANEKFHVPNTK